MKTRTIILSMSLLAATAAHGAAPKVIKTVPVNDAKDVDPGLREIRVTFDQDMSRSGFSVVGGGPTFPKLRGSARWVSPRIVVIPVQLEPDHEYWLSINSDKFTNFRNKQGEPAVPCPISFQTADKKSAASKPDPGTSNAEAIKELRRVIDEEYSYRDLRKLNWDDLFAKYKPAMEGATKPRYFADKAAELLANAQDIHIWIKVGDQTLGTFKRSVPWNIDLKTLANTVPGWKQRSRCVYTGRFDDGTGYILITSWMKNADNAHKAALDALTEFQKAPGLIVDVRPNSGGDEMLAQEFAGCFMDKPAVYSKNVIRAIDEPGGFTKPIDRVLEPNKNGPKYRGKVAVLIGQANMSSCESFILMMKQIPGCKLIGEKTYGASGNPKPHDLGNDVTVFLPSWKDMLPDGSLLEMKGIKPDIEVKYTPGESKSDAVLEAARKALRKP